jgi:hypothetical protein
MKVFCTQRFIDHLQQLSKNNSYKSILEDVCVFFSDKNIHELHMMNDIINRANGKYSLNKYRIANGLTNKGKSSSYRCICVCLPEQEAIYLDTIYPKTGSFGTDNLTKDAYKEISKNVLSAISANKLFILNIETKEITAAKKK